MTEKRAPYTTHAEAQLRARFKREFARLDNRPVTLQLTAADAWCLCSAVQLACRHPEFTGPTRTIAEAAARRIFQHITATPALAEVARRGWDPAFDEEPEP
jgi:hypothetical protein